MKKIIILIVILSNFTCATMAQQASLSNIVSFVLPAGTEKLSNENVDFKSFSTNANVKQYQKVRVINKGDLYRINNVTIQLNGNIITVSNDYLEQLKKGQDEVFNWSHPKYYKSIILNMNNFKVLIINYEFQNENIGHYNFYCIKNSMKSVLNGSAQYNISEKAKAIETNEELLNSIRFK